MAVGVFDWLKKLVGAGAPARSAPWQSEKPAAPDRGRRRARRHEPDFMPTPRRRRKYGERYKRQEALYRPEDLDRFDLPHLATIEDLAGALNITPGKLRWLTWAEPRGESEHYIRRTVPKKSGGKRLLCAPKAKMRAAQDWVFTEILRKIPVNSCAHGFIKRRCIVTNAQRHTGKDIVINVDLQDFFPSISMGTVVGLFEWMGYPYGVAWYLSMLCTCNYGRRRALPQGSPTSPAISNLVCWKLDRRLSGLAKKIGADYTRYADDLTFSGGETVAHRPGWFLGLVSIICKEEGLRVNPDKTRIMRAGSRQMVTGLVVNDKPNVDRREIRRLRAILHNCKTQGVSSQNRTNDASFRERLQGKIAMVRMVNADKGAQLAAQFQAIDWGS